MFALTRFSQMDPRWKDLLLGLSSSDTIGTQGCLLTDLAMVCAGCGYAETPASLNQKLADLGPGAGFIGALVVPAALPRILPGMVYRDFVRCAGSPAPLDRIDTALAAGWPVIVEVDYSPAAGLQNHWVVLYGKQGNDYLIQDPYPYPPEETPLTYSASRFAFAGDLARAITAVVWLEGPRPPAGRPEGALSVYASVDDLALRSQPRIDPANLLRRLPKGCELYSLEPAADTLAKVGANNTWLNVQDEQGTRGYCAAWYLGARPPETTTTPPASGALLLYANVDQLALRSQPVVIPSTLLKRLDLGAELTVTEDHAAALAKLGQVDQWIAVRDASGQAGYAAAWYLSAVKPVGLGPSTPPQTPPSTGPLFVRTTVPSLALRSQALIAPETLLKRLPAGMDLQVLDAPNVALPKIGQPNEWLRVRDPSGDEGYVAAWFVKKRE